MSLSLRAAFAAVLFAFSLGAIASIDDTNVTADGNYPPGGHSCAPNTNLYSVEIRVPAYGGASVKIQYTEPGTTDTYHDVPNTPAVSP